MSLFNIDNFSTFLGRTPLRGINITFTHFWIKAIVDESKAQINEKTSPILIFF